MCYGLFERDSSRARGKYLAFYQMLVPVGIAFAGLLTVIVLPKWGWRGCYFVEALPAATLFLVWKFCPESALWLESKGRLDEADRVVSIWEEKAQQYTGKPLPPVELKHQAPAREPGKISELFSRKYWKILLMCMIWYTCCMMSDYGLATWLTQLLVAKGFDIIKSTGFVALGVLGGIPGFFFVSWGVEKLGRKWTLFISSVMTAVFAYFYGLSSSIAMVIAMGILYQFGKYSLAITNNVYTPELFETHLRATGSGFGLACGRFGSIIGPVFLSWVMTTFGTTATFYAAAAVALTSGLAVMLLGPETKGKIF